MHLLFANIIILFQWSNYPISVAMYVNLTDVISYIPTKTKRLFQFDISDVSNIGLDINKGYQWYSKIYYWLTLIDNCIRMYENI